MTLRMFWVNNSQNLDMTLVYKSFLCMGTITRGRIWLWFGVHCRSCLGRYWCYQQSTHLNMAVGTWKYHFNTSKFSECKRLKYWCLKLLQPKRRIHHSSKDKNGNKSTPWLSLAKATINDPSKFDCLIIDKVSMVGCNMVVVGHSNLNYKSLKIDSTPEGVNIIFTGNFRQCTS